MAGGGGGGFLRGGGTGHAADRGRGPGGAHNEEHIRGGRPPPLLEHPRVLLPLLINL